MMLTKSGMNMAIITQKNRQNARKNVGGVTKHKYEVGRLAPVRRSKSSWGANLVRIESQRTICRPTEKGKQSIMTPAGLLHEMPLLQPVHRLLVLFLAESLCPVKILSPRFA
jgi:hypothetical protein